MSSDGSGLKTRNAGEYRILKYGDPEARQKRHLLSKAKKGIGIRSFYGDGAFDQSSMFNRLHSLKEKPVIKMRKNASADRYRGSKYRRREVREYRNLGYRRWAELNSYGMRWPGTEGIFSAVKRKFGENTVSRSEDGLLAEGYQRFWAYDEIKEYGEKHSSEGIKGSK